MDIVERAIVRLCQALLWVTISVIFVILAGNVALRYLTGSSLRWASELPELMFPWLVMAGVVMASVRGAHITTVFMLDSLPRNWQRRLLICGSLVVATAYAILTWATARMLPIVHDEHSPILGVPGSVTYGCVMVGLALIALIALSSAWRLWRGQPVRGVLADDEVGLPNLSS